MSLRLRFYQSNDTDPYRNLARELYLYETCQSDEVIFYLWQNEPTVVIGKNQSANAQCELKKMANDQVNLARRITGGGAVYHDLGNLNFTFIAPNNLYDQAKQTSVIIEALKLAGIQAEVSGRNDLETNGRKFSGNAYYHGKDISFQHGTLLLNSDLNKLASYLKINKEKIEKHGVNSVVSRVINLNQLRPELTLQELENNLVLAFKQIYQGDCQKKEFPEEALKKATMYKNIDEPIKAEGSMTIISLRFINNYASGAGYCKVNKFSSGVFAPASLYNWDARTSSLALDWFSGYFT